MNRFCPQFGWGFVLWRAGCLFAFWLPPIVVTFFLPFVMQRQLVRPVTALLWIAFVICFVALTRWAYWTLAPAIMWARYWIGNLLLVSGALVAECEHRARGVWALHQCNSVALAYHGIRSQRLLIKSYYEGIDALGEALAAGRFPRIRFVRIPQRVLRPKRFEVYPGTTVSYRTLGSISTFLSKTELRERARLLGASNSYFQPGASMAREMTRDEFVAFARAARAKGYC